MSRVEAERLIPTLNQDKRSARRRFNELYRNLVTAELNELEQKHPSFTRNEILELKTPEIQHNILLRMAKIYHFDVSISKTR